MTPVYKLLCATLCSIFLLLFINTSMADNHNDKPRFEPNKPNTQVEIVKRITSAPLIGNAFECSITNASNKPAKISIVEFINLEGVISPQTTGTCPAAKSNSFELEPWTACYILLTSEQIGPSFKRFYCRATLRGDTVPDMLRGVLQAHHDDLSSDPAANRDWMSASELK